MQNHPRRPTSRLIPFQLGNISLTSLGIARFDLRDPYHLAVSLPWPAFMLALLAVWLTINGIFACLYALAPGSIANTRPGSLSDAFFFSIETLATVGYGVMAPTTLYAHIVSAIEILTGTALTAIVTGLLFVRFSRPKPKMLYADDAVVTRHNGHPTLMVRLANGRMAIMTAANARLFALLGETTAEGKFFRRIHDLPLQQSHLPLFIVPWTVLHTIDETSPLFGLTATTLKTTDIRLILTIDAHDRALSDTVHDMKIYPRDTIRFGMRFADIVTVNDAGDATADLTRIGFLEPEGLGSVQV